CLLPYSSLFPYTTLFRSKSVKFVLSKFVPMRRNGGRLSKDLVADAFVVFNLCETGVLSTPVGAPLAPLVEKIVNRLLNELQEDRSEEHTSELQSQSNLVC